MPQDEINKLIVQRGRVKAKLTRFSNFLSTFIYNEPSDVAKLQIRLDDAQNILSEYNKIQDEYEVALFDSGQKDEDATNQERDEFETKYFDLISSAKTIIKNQTIQFEQPQGDSIALTPSSSSTSGNANPKIGIKLPEININDFHGGFENWSNFFDTFKSLIHDNPNLDNVQKFHYLNGAVKGEAAAVISSMKITSDNYNIAIQLLKDRYENKKATIHSHLKAILFDLPTVKPKSHVSLRQLVDTFLKHFRSLENLGENVQEWNSILICLITSKLDFKLREEWESYTKNKINIKTCDLTTFLSEKCIFLQSIENTVTSNKKYDAKSFYVSDSKSKNNNNNVQKCPLCKNQHYLYFCDRFKNMSVNDKYFELKRLNYCTNCIRPGHSPSMCRSGGCKKCNKKHSTILHGFTPTSAVAQPNEDSPSTSNIHNNNANNNLSSQNNGNSHETNKTISPKIHENNKSLLAIMEDHDNGTSMEESENFTVAHLNKIDNNNKYALLSTALVIVYDRNKQPVVCRTFLDSCSQVNLISNSLFQRLGTNFTNNSTSLSGVEDVKTKATKWLKLDVHSMHSDFKINLPFLTLKKITQSSPNLSFDISNLKIPENIKLADPKFNESSQIDMLIGAGVFYSLHCIGQIKLGENLPVLQKTRFGWVASGYMNCIPQSNACFLTLSDLDSQLQRFWNIEENQSNLKGNNYSREELECENHFINTTRRTETGRFVVSLPVKDNITDLGESQEIAKKRFYSLERRLEKNPILYNEYRKFMTEYINLGHMSKINIHNVENSETNVFYMSHHSVEKLDSTTTRTRIVFNASMQSSSGISLNDALKVGPTVQNDLFTILVQFRQHVFVLIGDLAKMYRQILVEPQQRNLQRIVWRENSNNNLDHYTLNTVTYGTAPASFLATRCLIQISEDVQTIFPNESKIIKNDFYIDDLLTGCDDINQLISIRKNVTQIFSEYGFHLRKFLSNEPSVLFELQEKSKKTNFIVVDGNTTKTLGITWNANSDSFIYHSIKKPEKHNKVTKRNILSYISQQFDPLGLLVPITIRSKLIMQSLWQLKLDWDESLPLDLHNRWTNLFTELLNIDQIIIPRLVKLKNTEITALHGFSDASEKAYGACIYVVTSDREGNKSSVLLCAKSRVAPLKTITLPRLELCGAVILARLINKCSKILKIDSKNISCYSDSNIVLCWLSREPNTLKTFVSNRTSEILELTQRDNWFHVNSSENPADLITRGSSPNNLKVCSLWWKGPQFLNQNHKINKPDYVKQISHYYVHNSELPEQKFNKLITFVFMQDFDIFNKFSSLTKLQRIVAYCLRFIGNLKASAHISSKAKQTRELNIEEVENSIKILIKMAQNESFSKEIKALNASKNVFPSSKLSSLNPFLDIDGIVRVGGRLKHSQLSYNNKHPVVLPNKHPLTRLIILHEHKRSLHGGLQVTLSHVRQNYWPLHGKQVVKSIIRSCIICFKAKPFVMNQQMGELPAARVTPSRVFSSCGLDYAGPFELKEGKTRNRKIIKAYICIFVCLSSKACHIELVTELTVDGFLATLRRFVSRRGLPTDLYSDNATNFVGSNRILIDTMKKIAQSNKFSDYLLNSRIKWHFIPPRAPHFGGLWESAVKSTKTHLKRILNNTPLTFEEFYTFLTQVEAVLNSRPLTSHSNDPNDMEVLTPGHFIIGQALTSLPERSWLETPINHVKRFHHIQRMVQSFWSRWKMEYLHNLQERHKWKFKDVTSLLGSIVLIKEENAPPLSWPMGRIVEIHPSEDGSVRVVTVTTRHGSLKRPITKLCLLPLDNPGLDQTNTVRVLDASRECGSSK